jgi:hypothetical protein
LSILLNPDPKKEPRPPDRKKFAAFESALTAA